MMVVPTHSSNPHTFFLEYSQQQQKQLSVAGTNTGFLLVFDQKYLSASYSQFQTNNSLSSSNLKSKKDSFQTLPKKASWLHEA